MRKKRKSSQQCHLALSGPTSVKAARKMLVKLTQGLNFSGFDKISNLNEKIVPCIACLLMIAETSENFHQSTA